jgi:alpha-amylase
MKKSILFACALLIAASASAKKVKFSVDMSNEVLDSNGVHVTGDFQAAAGFGTDWDPATTLMTQEASTNIFSVIVDIPAFAKYEFKFLNGAASYALEFVPEESRVQYNFNDNRWIYVDSLMNDTLMIAPVLFSGNAPVGKYLLRFRVDMQSVTVDPAGAHVAGAFQNWNPASTQLYSFDGAMYEYITYVDTLSVAIQQEFKYYNGNAAAASEVVPGSCATANGNRGVYVPKDTVLESICFSYCSSCATIGIGEELVENDLRVYPVPAENSVTVEFTDGKTTHEIILRDMAGRVVRTYAAINGDQLEIQRGDLVAGIYFVTVDSGGNEPGVRKLIFN